MDLASMLKSDFSEVVLCKECNGEVLTVKITENGNRVLHINAHHSFVRELMFLTRRAKKTGNRQK